MSRRADLAVSRERTERTEVEEPNITQKLYSANEKLRKQLLKPLQMNNRVRMRAALGEANPDRMIRLTVNKHNKNYDNKGQTLIENFCETRKIMITFDKQRNSKRPKTKVIDHLKTNIDQKLYNHIKLIKNGKNPSSEIAFVQKPQGMDMAVKTEEIPMEQVKSPQSHHHHVTNSNLSHKAEFKFTSRKVLLYRTYENLHVNPKKHDFVAETIKFNKEKRRELDLELQTARAMSAQKSHRSVNLSRTATAQGSVRSKHEVSTITSAKSPTNSVAMNVMTPKKPSRENFGLQTESLTPKEDRISRTFRNKRMATQEDREGSQSPNRTGSNTSRRMGGSQSNANLLTLDSRFKTDGSVILEEKTPRDRPKYKFDENPLRLALLANIQKSRKREGSATYDESKSSRISTSRPRTSAADFMPNYTYIREKSASRSTMNVYSASSARPRHEIKNFDNFQGESVKIKEINDFYPDAPPSEKKKKSKRKKNRNNSSTEVRQSIRQLIKSNYGNNAPSAEKIDDENIYLLRNYGYHTEIIDINLNKYELPKKTFEEEAHSGMSRETRMAILKADKLIQKALSRNYLV